jgi:hypothetical protein
MMREKKIELFDCVLCKQAAASNYESEIKEKQQPSPFCNNGRRRAETSSRRYIIFELIKKRHLTCLMCCDSHSRRYYRDEPEPIGGHRPQPLAFRVVMRPSLRAANYFALGTLFALHVARLVKKMAHKVLKLTREW